MRRNPYIYMSPKGATSNPDWRSYEYDQIEVSLCSLCLLCCLGLLSCVLFCVVSVLNVSALAKWLAGKTYSRDIFRVEGFPYKDQIEEIFIVMVYY